MGEKLSIDLVTRRPDGGYELILVEQGPWNGADVDSQLDRVQMRLNAAVGFAVDGLLASKFPDSHGQAVVIRLDCYDVPRRPTEELFSRFASAASSSTDLQHDIATKGHVTRLEFEYTWDTLRHS